MTAITLQEATDNLGVVLRRALAGEEVIITRDESPVVRVSPVATPIGRREPGGAEGRFIIHEDFDDPLPEDILNAFE